jgi:hypothetical protein
VGHCSSTWRQREPGGDVTDRIETFAASWHSPRLSADSSPLMSSSPPPGRLLLGRIQIVSADSPLKFSDTTSDVMSTSRTRSWLGYTKAAWTPTKKTTRLTEL